MSTVQRDVVARCAAMAHRALCDAIGWGRLRDSVVQPGDRAQQRLLHEDTMPRVARVLACGCACVGLSRELCTRWIDTIVAQQSCAEWVLHHSHRDRKCDARPMSTDTGEPHLHGEERDESTARDDNGEECDESTARDDNARIVARDPEAPGMERVDVGKRARVSALRTALPPEIIQRIAMDYIPLYMSKMKLAHHQLLHEDQFLRLTNYRFDFCVDYEFAERIPELECVD